MKRVVTHLDIAFISVYSTFIPHFFRIFATLSKIVVFSRKFINIVILTGFDDIRKNNFFLKITFYNLLNLLITLLKLLKKCIAVTIFIEKVDIVRQRFDTKIYQENK